MNWTTVRKLKILHFDIENRPLSYWADRPSAEVTAIAWSWSDSDTVDVYLLGITTPAYMLRTFTHYYNEADIVTGHYIRKHDLPILNGALIDFELGALKPKLTSDTKLDMVKKGDLPASQEALCGYFNIPAEKVHMTQADWREANRLTGRGLEKTKKRVVGDVLQHKLMRAEMIKRGLLKEPKMWRG
jgi:hypothetical protein